MPSVEPIRAFSDNYIWALPDRPSGRAVVVDPGDATPVLDWLAREQLTLAGILITHHHPDHTGGIERLLAHATVPVYGPRGEHIPHRSVALAEGDWVKLEAPALEFQVLEIPGHTAGHIAYYGHGLLFCGDTLFAGGCGRLFEGTPEQMYGSLGKLAALPSDTQVYCAHEYTEANLRFAARVEPDNQALRRRMKAARALRAEDRPTVPSTLAEEQATNPFLRVNEPAVIERAEAEAGHGLASPVDVFAAVRAWKDRG